MNKKMKLQLEAVIDAIVEGDSDAAKASFHEYLRAKTQAILIGESDDEECDEDMEDEKDEKEDKDDKKEDEKEDKKEDKKSKKDDE